MIVYLCTDMEGLGGVDRWSQFQPEHPDDPDYQQGRDLLTDQVNDAVSGCFDAGATEVRVLDGHGYNSGQNIRREKLDPRARLFTVDCRQPLRIAGVDETVHAIGFIGQHAMAGTLNGLFDHTGNPKVVCRFLVNGLEQGEAGIFGLYGGHFGIPIFYASGDEALCAEIRHTFPHAVTTPTKRGTGWETCELYPIDEVRAAIRRDIAAALRRDRRPAYRLPAPLTIEIEWAWSGLADRLARFPHVQRPHARRVSWKIESAFDIYARPSAAWLPLAASSHSPV